MLLVGSVVASICSLLVQSTDMIKDSEEIAELGNGVINAYSNELAKERLKKLVVTIAGGWSNSSATIHKVNSIKSNWLTQSQWMLLAGVFVTLAGILSILTSLIT